MASLALLLVASCGPGARDQDPGGLTADEAKALDEAAEMLQQRLPIGGQGDQPEPGPEQPAGEAGETKPDA